MKAVDGEMMKLGVHVLDDLHSPASSGGQKEAPSSGSKVAIGDRMPGGPQEVKTKSASNDGKFNSPGGNQEVTAKRPGGIPLTRD
jgi:hypothetical protein